MDLLTELQERISAGLVNKTLTHCSRWAEHRRIMGEPLPGKYSFKHHPWCREIHDSRASTNTTMKAAQMGMTEIAINRALFTIDVLKKDVLYVLPTAINAGDFAKARFNTALTYSDYLKEIFTDTNTSGLKQAGGVCLYIRGSRGDSNLKSIPVAVLILDELDEMDPKQIHLAKERLSGHKEKSIWQISTPTIPDKGIHEKYIEGTQEHYIFKCPRCGRQTELVYPDCLEIIGESITDPRVHESFLKCRECGGRLEHETKTEWLSDANCEWVPTVTDCDESHRSFYINQLYSYAMMPGEIAQAHFHGLGDEAAQVEFNNSKLGLPYVPDGGQVTDDELKAAVRDYRKNDQRPTGPGRLITMGVDQGAWNHICIVEYFVTGGQYDINAESKAKLLWEGKRDASDFKELDRLMREWQILACVIDARPQINDARRFARRFPGYVWLCTYPVGVAGKELQEADADSGAPILKVDRTNWLDASQGRFHSGRIVLPLDVSLEFKDNIKAPIRTYKRDDLGNAQAIYLNTKPDHYAHAFNYAEIALPLAAGITTSQDITDKVV